MSKWLSRKVAQYDSNGKYIKTWHSGKEAAKELGIHYSNIARSASGKRFGAGKFFWQYVNRDDIVGQIKICQCCGAKVEQDSIVAISIDCLRKYKQVI